MNTKTRKPIVAELVDLPLPASLRATTKKTTAKAARKLDFHIRDYHQNEETAAEAQHFAEATYQAMKEGG